jgi:carbon monoxide dehydrogenase subunit G
MRTLMVLGVLMLSVASLGAATGAAPGNVVVQEQQGMYRVTAWFVVPEAPAAVLGVLSDYEQIPRFMPGVKTSVVRSRAAGRTVVEQEAHKRVMLFSRTVHLLLDISETADALTFVDTSGRSFTSYEGSWRVLPTDTGTLVTYELNARPAFEVPGFVLLRLLKSDSTDMIAQLKAEIAAR